jgi:hypothetical protein
LDYRKDEKLTSIYPFVKRNTVSAVFRCEDSENGHIY